MERPNNTHKDISEWIKGQIIALKKLYYSYRGMKNVIMEISYPQPCRHFSHIKRFFSINIFSFRITFKKLIKEKLL